MERPRNCYDALHSYATQAIRVHASRLARARLIPGMTVEDYEQELALDLHRRLRAYNPEKAGLATFIDRTVRNRVCGFLAAARAAARHHERAVLPLNGAEGEDDGGLAARLRTADGLWACGGEFEDDLGLRHDLGRFIASLPAALGRCCAILMSGSAGQAVRREGLHRSSHYEARDRLRRRARGAGLHDYLGRPRQIEERPGK